MDALIYLPTYVTLISSLAFLATGYIYSSICTALLSIPCVMLFYWFTIEYCGNALSLSNVQSAIIAIEDLDKEYFLKRYDVKVIVDEEIEEMLNDQGGKYFFLYIKPKYETSPPVGTLKAYTDFFNTSIIILPFHPGNISGANLFHLYHEIGHLTSSNINIARKSKNIHIPLAVSILPALMLVNKWDLVLCALIIYIFVWYMSDWEGKIEVSADQFAVAMLFRHGMDETKETLRIIYAYFLKKGEIPSINEKTMNDRKDFFHRARYLFTRINELENGNIRKIINPSLSFDPIPILHFILGLFVVAAIVYSGGAAKTWVYWVLPLASLFLPYIEYKQDKRLNTCREELNDMLNKIPLE